MEELVFVELQRREDTKLFKQQITNKENQRDKNILSDLHLLDSTHCSKWNLSGYISTNRRVGSSNI